MRVVIQGPPPTQPVIQVNQVEGSGSELDVVLVTASTGPAPPYVYRLERATNPANPVNWVTVAEGASVFQGDPATLRVGGFNEGALARFRITATDSASPARSSTPVVSELALTYVVTPTPFEFTDLVDQATSAVVQSGVVVIQGTTGPSPISIENGEYQINGGAWTAGDGLISAGNQLRIRTTTPSTTDTEKVVTVTVGSYSTQWSVTTEEVAFAWPVQAADGRIHALPGVNIWGSDSYGGSGRDPVTNGVDIIIVDSLATSNTGSAHPSMTDTYVGSIEYAIRFNNGNRAKQIVIATSGSPGIHKTINGVTDYTSLWGQFAPAPGFYPRGWRMNSAGRIHWQVWHLPMYVGDGPESSVSYSNRDGWALGNRAPDPVTHAVFINCEFFWCTDEAFDGNNFVDQIGLLYCVFAEGIQDPDRLPNQGGPRAFGPFVGGTSGGDRVSFERCIFAHNVDRNPSIACRLSTLANNIHYNLGRVPSGAGEAVQYRNMDESRTLPLQHNVIGSLFVRGPNNNNSLVAVMCKDLGSANEFPKPAGSGCAINGCGQNGWSNPGSQIGFVTDFPSGFGRRTSPFYSSALPSGRTGSDVYQLASGAFPNQQEIGEFFELMSESVGAYPGRRTLQYGRVQRLLNQIAARLNGTTGEGQQILTEYPGYFSVPVTVVNPLNPGNHWHAPIPTASNRHTPYTSGTFSNGKSRVGYTPMEVWAIEQHYYVGGK